MWQWFWRYVQRRSAMRVKQGELVLHDTIAQLQVLRAYIVAVEEQLLLTRMDVDRLIDHCLVTTTTHAPAPEEQPRVVTNDTRQRVSVI